MPETRKISFTQPPFESDDADFSSFPRSCVGMPGCLSTSNQPKAAHRFPRRSMGTRNRYTLFSARCVDSRLRGNDGVFLLGIGVVGRCHDFSSFPRSCVGMPGCLSTSNQPKAAHRFPRRSMGTRNRYTLFSARCVDSRLRGNDGVFLLGIGVVGRCHDFPRSHAPAWECLAVSPQAINPKQPTGSHAGAWEPETATRYSPLAAWIPAFAGMTEYFSRALG